MKSETLEIFNLEKEVAKVINAKTTNSNSTVDPRIIQEAKIQKVPAFLRERPDFSKYYSPKLLSIGPIHHHSYYVKVGEQYKRLWTATYLSTRLQEGPEGGELTMSNNSTSTCEQKCAFKELIINKYKSKKDDIVKVIERCYNEEVIEEYKYNNYEALAWMLFVDGCSVLEFMNKASYEKPEALKIKIDQLILMQQDLLLLENQIPFELLKLLCKDTNELSKSMLYFLQLYHMVPASVIESKWVPICQQPICKQPTHLLDYLRKILCDDLTDNQNPKTPSVEQTTINTFCLDICQLKKQKDEWPRNRNIKELKEAGIEVALLNMCLMSRDRVNLGEILFSPSLFFSGVLYLQRFVVDNSSATTFSNLTAYEACPDFKNDFIIGSYVAFLSSLIDHPEDVKELRRAGILYNNLGSDQEVADLFNTITTNLVSDPKMYDDVKRKMEKHCNNRLKTWIAGFKYRHSISLCHSPTWSNYRSNILQHPWA